MRGPHPDLSEPEALLWEAFPRGRWVDLRSGVPERDGLAAAPGWGPERTIRAEVIAALLLGAAEPAPGSAPAIRLRGARVSGRLDLMGATVEAALICEYCVFEEPLRLVEAAVRTVRVVGGRLRHLNAARMRLDGILNLSGSRVDAGVRLDRARVAGEVSLRGAALGPDQDGVGLAADGLAVEGGGLECNEGFTAGGEVRLRGARIDALVDLSDATVTGRAGMAIDADHMTVNGPLTADRLTAAGELRLRNATITSSLHLEGARLRNPGGIALGCAGLAIDGGIWCRNGFTAEGEVRFTAARPRGVVCLDGAVIGNPGGLAVKLDRAELGTLEGAELAVTAGMVSMLATKVAGNVVLERARLGGPEEEIALWMETASIGGSLRLQGLRAAGEVRIRSSTVSRRVMLMGGWLESPDEVALRFTRNEVGLDVVCDDLVAIGEARFVDCAVGRHLDLDQVHLVNPGGVALDCRMLRAAELSLLPAAPVQGTVILAHAAIGLLRDDPERWPDVLRMDGLTYQTLQPPMPAARRLDWIARDPGGYQPQAYEQLARHYTGIGLPAETRRVLHAGERRQRETRPPLGRVWGTVQEVTIAYGYQPWRAVMWFALVLAVGSLVYWAVPPEPLKPGEAPHFNAFAYTLDLLLPIVDLGQERAFNPEGAAQWLSYLLIAAGWILATTIAAAVARIVSRR